MTNDNKDYTPLAALNAQLREVVDSLDASDGYDLNSEDLTSCRVWAELTVAYVKDVLALIEIVKNHETELRDRLQEGIDAAQGLIDAFKKP